MRKRIQYSTDALPVTLLLRLLKVSNKCPVIILGQPVESKQCMTDISQSGKCASVYADVLIYAVCRVSLRKYVRVCELRGWGLYFSMYVVQGWKCKS